MDLLLRAYLESRTICRILQKYSAPCSATYVSKLFSFVHKQRSYRYQKHVKTCREHSAAKIFMPKASNTSLLFRNWKARWFLPIVLYFDTESYLVPFATAQPAPSTSYTVAMEKHEHWGYAIAAIEHGKATPVYFELKRGDNCLNELVISLHVLVRDI